jgi:hypothetical protein
LIDWPPYVIYESGRVERVTGKRHERGVVTPHAGHWYGYLKINLMHKRHRQHFWLHRLVCTAFHGAPPKDKPVVRHLDGDPTNNHADNLRWGTRSENEFDKGRGNAP